MRIPNAENAVVDIRKLRDYALNTDHRVGRHKARLFSALLSMDAGDVEALRDELLRVVGIQDATPGIEDEHGQRYRIDFTFSLRGREAIILSAWIIRSNEDFPRLVTCYPLEELAK